MPDSPLQDQDYVRWFDSLGLDDVPLLGGKTASLAELHRLLSGGPIQAPDGFALTADAYREVLTAAGAWAPLRALLDGLDTADVAALSRAGAEARALVYEAAGHPALRRRIVEAYRALKARLGGRPSFAVRSSATAEDLPTAFLPRQGIDAISVNPDSLPHTMRTVWDCEQAMRKGG